MAAVNQPPPPAAQPQGWGAYLSATAYGIGQKICTLATGAKDVVTRRGGPLIESTAIKAVQAGAAIYQAVPGGQKAAPLTAKLLMKTLPDVATLQKAIDAHHTNLDAIAESGVPRELAKATAVYARSFVQHCISNAETIDPAICPKWVKDTLLHKSAADKISSGFIGDTAKAIISQRPEVVQKIVELNLSKGLCNVFAYIKQKQDDDPNWLVHFAKEFCDSITKELQGKADAKPMSEEESGALFVKTFSDKILEIALPAGAEDLELHSASLSFLKKPLFDLVKDQILPDALHGLYKDATSDYTRDYLVNQAVKYLKNFFETGSFGGLQGAAPPEKVGKKAPHLKPDEQAAFGKSLAAGADAMLQTLDPDLANIAKKNKVGEMLQASSETIIESLQDINLLQSANGLLKNAMPLIFPAGKEVPAKEVVDDKAYRFEIAEPIAFPKTRADVEKLKQPQLKKQKALVKETEGIMKSITSNLSGLFDTIATAIVGKMHKNPEGFRQKCNNFFTKVGHVLVRSFVKFVFWTTYTDVMKSTLHQAHKYAQDLSIGRVGAPARRVITRRVLPQSE